MKSPTRKSLSLATLVLSAGAIGMGAYLLVYALSLYTTIRACGGGDCEEVLNSKWATWYGFPVVACGVAMYVAYFVAFLLLVLSTNNPLRCKLRLFLAWTATLIVLGAVYFVVLQGAVLGAFCRLCMVTHSFGVLAVTTGWMWNKLVAGNPDEQHELASAVPKQPDSVKPQGYPHDTAGAMLARQLSVQRQQVSERPSRSHFAVVTGVATAVFTIFAVSHVLDPGPETHIVINSIPDATQLVANLSPRVTEPGLNPTNAESLPRVRLPGNIEFSRDRFPGIGSADAPHVIVKLFDYQCNSCEDMHGYFKKTLPDYHGQFALVLIPCPLERACYPDLSESVEDHIGSCELAKLALAMWRIAPDRFEEYHDWLIETRPSLKAARVVANEYAGKQALQSALDNPSSLHADIEIAAELFRSNGIPKMPKTFLPSGHIVIGATRGQKEMRTLLDEEIRILSRQTTNTENSQ